MCFIKIVVTTTREVKNISTKNSGRLLTFSSRLVTLGQRLLHWNFLFIYFLHLLEINDCHLVVFMSFHLFCLLLPVPTMWKTRAARTRHNGVIAVPKF